MNVLIVEDEALVALDLSQGLRKEGYHIVGTADNADDAKELFLQNEVDIILMDVKIMGEKDGIDTATELLRLKQVPIIYLTAFTDATTISRIKSTFPAAFLSKPYNITNVRIAIDLAINNLAIARQPAGEGKVVAMDKSASKQDVVLQMDDVLFVKFNYRFIKVRISELLYVEADNNYINLVTNTRKIALRLSLNQWLDKVNHKSIVRIHRSYAVNMDSIHSFSDQSVFIDKMELPLGKNYRECFFRHFDFQ